MEVEVNSAEDDIFNGILSALGVHVLRDGDRPPPMLLTITQVSVGVDYSGASKGCTNTQTVELLFTYSWIGGPPEYTAVGLSRGRSCLERQSDGFAAKQSAIGEAVAEIRSQLAAKP
jgi:hypothetical protein